MRRNMFKKTSLLFFLFAPLFLAGLLHGEALAQENNMLAALSSKPRLLVFLNAKAVSRSDFVEYMKQTYQIGGTIVLRGFVSEGPSAMVDTQRYIAQLNEQACANKCPATITIDPKLFEYYQISAVPSFVLAVPSYKNDKLASKDGFVKYTDLVPLDYVLKLFSEKANAVVLRQESKRLYNRLVDAPR